MGEFSRTPAQCFHDSLSEMLSRSSGNAEALGLDPLSEVLRDFRPSGVSYGHCRLTKPWGVDFPEDSSTRLHFLVAGECWFRKEKYEPMRLRAGDVVLLPKGGAHAMADTPRGRTRPLSSFPRQEIGDRNLSGSGWRQRFRDPVGVLRRGF
jgi:hypothetical protein